MARPRALTVGRKMEDAEVALPEPCLLPETLLKPFRSFYKLSFGCCSVRAVGKVCEEACVTGKSGFQELLCLYFYTSCWVQVGLLKSEDRGYRALNIPHRDPSTLDTISKPVFKAFLPCW